MRDAIDGLCVLHNGQSQGDCDKFLVEPSFSTRLLYNFVGVIHIQRTCIGMYDGAVAIFDVRKRDSKPILEVGLPVCLETCLS